MARYRRTGRLFTDDGRTLLAALLTVALAAAFAFAEARAPHAPPSQPAHNGAR